MPPGHVADADLYVVGNCVHYRPQDISQLADAPVTKIVNDAWRYGHPRVREQLIDRADLFILRSPIHQERLECDLPEEKVELLPSWVDLDRFRPRVRTSLTSALWLANIDPERRAGYLAVQQWAENHDVPFDAYGRGCPNGPVRYEDVPSLMAAHRWYGHAMGDGDYEPYGRATIEAWAATSSSARKSGRSGGSRTTPTSSRRRTPTFGSWRTSASYQRDRPHHPRQGTIISTVRQRVPRPLRRGHPRNTGHRGETQLREAWLEGAEQSTGDYLLLCADDLEPRAGWWVPLVEAADRNLLSCPVVLLPTGTVQSAGGGLDQPGHLRSWVGDDWEPVDFTTVPF